MGRSLKMAISFMFLGHQPKPGSGWKAIQTVAPEVCLS